jgi:hypothetical protein
MELTDLPENEFFALREAKRRLEYPSFTARLTDLLGKPIDQVMKYLPEGVHQRIGSIATEALMKGLEINLKTFDRGNGLSIRRSRNNLHKLAVGVSGGISGAFGLASIPVELPVSTMVILRSIMDIARSEGHDIESPEVKLACMEVFALGGYQKGDDASESGYWLVRAALAREVSEALAYLSKGAAAKAPPAIVRLITTIASRFSVQVSEQVAAKAIPVVGIVTGSAINVMFMNHFQSVAKGHFIIRRLEGRYGRDAVKKLYGECPT